MGNKYLIDKDFINEYDLSGEALMVLICIKIKYRNNEAAFSCGLLEYYIYGYENTDESKKDAVAKGLSELITKDVIKVKSKMRNSVVVCDISNIMDLSKDKFYTSITKSEFTTIINLKEGSKRYDILKFFLQIIGTIDCSKSTKDKYRFSIGHLSQNSLSSILNISVPTLIKYNRILVNNKLLYIINRKTLKRSENTGMLYNAMSNVYGRYEDKELCEEYLKESGFEKKDNVYVNTINEMRSLSQKYNYFKRTYENTVCEDIEKVMRAYNAAKQWNEYAKQDYENAILDGKKVDEPEYKDLSIFDKYDLTV